MTQQTVALFSMFVHEHLSDDRGRVNPSDKLALENLIKQAEIAGAERLAEDLNRQIGSIQAPTYETHRLFRKKIDQALASIKESQ